MGDIETQMDPFKELAINHYRKGCDIRDHHGQTKQLKGLLTGVAGPGK